MYERQPVRIRRLDGDRPKRRARRDPPARRRSKRSRPWSTSTPSTLYRVAFSVLRNAADAEDAVQEAFLRVLRHRDTLGEVRDHRVWLIRIVWNIVLDRKRRAKTRPETDDIADLARVLPANGLSAEAACRRGAASRACAGLRRPASRQGARSADAFGLRGAFQRGDCRGARHYRVQRSLAPVSRAQPDGRPARSREEVMK